MTVIKDNEGVVLARHIFPEDMEDGLTFFSKPTDNIQVGTWRYSDSTHLQRHIHKDVERIVDRTSEVLIVVRGRVLALIYDEKREPVKELMVHAGEILVLLKGGHEYVVLEHESLVYEIKNGPYVGAEMDRERF